MNSKELNKICESLSNYVLVFQRILHESLNREIDARINLLFIIIISKNIDSINSLSILIKSSKFQHIIYSVASILRGGALNGMIALFMSKKVVPEKVDNEQSEVILQIEKLYSDQVEHLIRDLKLLFENKKGANQEELVKYINKEYQHFLSEPIFSITDKPKFKHSSTRFGSRKLVENSYSKEQSIRFLESYIYYSKFDHIGIVTSNLYSSAMQNIKGEIQMMLDGIINLVYINYNYKSHLNLSSKNLKKVEEITDVLYCELNYESKK